MRVTFAAVDPTRVAEGVEMITLERVGLLAFVLWTGALGPWGCAPASETDLDAEDEENAAQAFAAFQMSDRQRGYPQGGTEPSDPDTGCMASCRGAFDGCVANCSVDRPNCIAYCHDAYRDCVRSSCGYGGNRGGCNSLNSADCNPWWFGNP